MQRITSAQNPRLRAAIRLKTSRGRKTQRRVIIFGFREVQRAVDCGIVPLEIFLSSEVLSADEIGRLQKQVPGTTAFYDLPETLLGRLKYGERADSVIAVAARPELSLQQLDPSETSLVVILQAIEKPGNIGAVLRSMDAVSAHALILADPLCDVLHPNSIRASMGSVFTIPVAVCSTAAAIDWCRENDLTLFAAADSAATPYTDADLTGRVAIALGNEASGLSADWREEGISGLRIPMAGISDSLNISVAAGVILFESRRQRTLRTPQTGRTDKA